MRGKRGAVLGVLAAAVVLAGGLFSWHTTASSEIGAPLNVADALFGDSTLQPSIASTYQPESVEKLSSVISIQKADGQALALDDIPSQDYSGFLFSPAGSLDPAQYGQQVIDAGTAEQIQAKLQEATGKGDIRKVADDIYAADSLDTIAGLFSADELAYVEPDFNLQLLDDADPYTSSSLATSQQTNDKLQAQGAPQAQSELQAQAGLQAQAESQAQNGMQAQGGLQIQSGLQAQAELQAQSDMQAQSGLQAQGGTPQNPAPEWPPNDQYYASGALWNLNMLNVQGAWQAGLDGDVYNYNGKPVRASEDGTTPDPVKVAIIDTGLFGTGKTDTVKHEDLNYENIVSGYNFIGGVEGEAPDAHGHGTFVAGLIAAVPNNAKGVAGAQPNVVLVPEKVFDTGSASTEDVISAIYHAVDNMQVDVINMSLGGEYNERALQVACDYAVSKGVLVVASAGNDGNTTPNYPAAYDSVVGVASVNSNKARSTFSQIGKSVFVTAPGESVTSTYKDGAASYYTASGTSFSGPEVAALAALVKSVYPDCDQDIFKQFLIDTSTDLGAVGFDDYYGWGLVDFSKMAEAVLASQVLPWYNVSVTVTGETGAALSDAQIELTAAENIQWEASEEGVEPAFAAGGISAGTKVEPGADGIYRIHRGTYAYTVTAPGFYTTTGTFRTYTENQTLAITLQTAYETTIQVVDSEGQPIPGATLEVVSDRHETPKEVDATTQTHTFDLATGAYTFTASADGYKDAKGSFIVQWNARSFALVLYRETELRSVSFACVDAADNRPLSTGVSIAVRDANRVVITPQSPGAYLLAAGKTYTVQASKAGYESSSVEFTVGEDAQQEKQIALTAAQNVYTFNVVDESGKAITTAKAKVTDEEGTRVEPRVDNPLRFSLVAGSYTYEVSAPGYKSATGTLQVNMESHTITLTLEAVPHTVTFVVTDADTGVVIQDPAIKVSAAGTLRSLPRNANGTWTLTPGAYRYTVYKSGYVIAEGDFVVAGEDVAVGVVLAQADSQQIAYAGGSGTPEDPYLIATEEQLRYLARQTEVVRMTNTTAETNRKDALTESYKLVADIQLTQGEWLPIGNSENSSNYASFSGTFDGAGHTVSGMYINQPTYDNQGFFGYVVGATIKNLTVEGRVTGGSYVGGLIGGVKYSHSSLYPSSNTDPTLIEQCGSNVTVQGRYAVGGLVGSAQATDNDISGTFYDPGTAGGITISRCYSEGAVAAMKDGSFTANASAAGGIVGSAKETIIVDCYTGASVEAGYNAGGLIGNAQICNVANAYSSGMVAQYVTTGTGYSGTAGGNAGRVYYCVFTSCPFLLPEGSSARAAYGSADAASRFDDCAEKEHAQMYRSQDFLSFMNLRKATDTVGDAFVLGRAYPLLSWQVAPDALLAPAPYITAQPQGMAENSAYRQGDQAQPLTAQVADVSEGTLTWAWYVSSSAQERGTVVPEATGTGTQATWTPSTTERGVFYYRCLFTNTVSTETDYDAADALSVAAAIYVRSSQDAQIPLIEKLNPSQTNVIQTELSPKQGTDQELSCVASVTDGGTLSYQWYCSTALGGSAKSKAIVGATAPTYDVDTSALGTMYYYVEITNTTEPGNSAVVRSEWITVDVVEYAIADYQDLLNFRTAVNGGTTFEGQIITLKSDIQIPNGVQWQPIGTEEHPFMGTFMGGTGRAGSDTSIITAHKITGLVIDGGDTGVMYAGLFGHTRNATLCDLQVGGRITGVNNTYAGLLAGYAYASNSNTSTIENCSTLPGSLVEGKYAVGGLVGVTGSALQCVANHADVHAFAYIPTETDKAAAASAKAVGGVVGYNNYGVVACAYNTGAIITDALGEETGSTCPAYVGGIAGNLTYYSGIASAYNAGKITVGTLAENRIEQPRAVQYAGSLAGYVASGMVNLHYLEDTFTNGTNNSYTPYGGPDYADYHSKAFMKTAYFVRMMNTGSNDYSTDQFVQSTNGVPHLVWEAENIDDSADIVSAEPWITDVRAQDMPSLTSTWKGTYFQNGSVQPIYVLVDSPDGGTLTYVWQRREVIENDKRGQDDDWEDIQGSEGIVPAEGEGAGIATYTIDVSQPHTAQYRILVTNKRSDATADDPDNPMQATIPAITIEVKDASEGLYLRDMSKPNSEDNPWVIDTAQRLRTFGALVAGSVPMPGLEDTSFKGHYVVLDADIDVSDEPWVPIGGTFDSLSHAGAFSGIFDGQNHVVSGIAINRSGSSDYQGFFASLYYASVRNLEVEGTIVANGAAYATGGIAGYAYGTHFRNIVNRVNVTGCDRVGGIVSYAGACKIEHCENLGTIQLNESALSSRYSGTMVGGIVGYFWMGAAKDAGAGIYNCLNAGAVQGRVTDGEYRFGALAGELGFDISEGALANNYYLAGTITSANDTEIPLSGIGAKSYEPISDAEGICEAVEAAAFAQTAWKLNTTGGTADHARLWGNFERNDSNTAADVTAADNAATENTATDNAVQAQPHLVRGDAAAVLYRVDTNNAAANISARPQYATAGETIKVSWGTKAGFVLNSVGWHEVDSDEVTNLGSAANGINKEIVMPASDVAFDVDYTQDERHRYALATRVTYKAATAPADACTVDFSAESAGDGAPAGEMVTARVTLVEGYQIARLAIEGLYGTPVTLTAQDALTYTFTMPAENVVLALVLEDSGTAASRRAASLAVTRDAVHRYTSQSSLRTADLLYHTITLSGDVVGPKDALMTYEVEGLSNPGLYEQRYSISGDGIHTYTGMDLAAFLRQFLGALEAETAVLVEAADGSSYATTYGALLDLVYNCYDETGQPLPAHRGLPVLLSFGCDGTPNATGVDLIVGQTAADDNNARACLHNVVRICLGEDVNYSQHVWGVYTDMDAICGGTANATQGQSDLHIRVYKGSSNTPAGETVVSLEKIEQLARRDRGGIQHGYYSTAIYEGTDRSDDYSGPYTDFYEGYDLYRVLKLAGIPYEPDADVQFYQSGRNGLDNSWKTVNVSLGYLAGNGPEGEGDYSNNFMNYEGDGYPSSGTLNGIRPMIAYGKNGYPLVWYSGSAGVANLAYNYRGPLVAILPQNRVEGGSYVGNNTVASCYLALMDIHLSEDADYTPVASLANQEDYDAANSVLNLIAALPTDVATADQAAQVDAAQKAYNALTPEARAVVALADGALARLDSAVEAAQKYRAGIGGGQVAPGTGGDQITVALPVKAGGVYVVGAQSYQVTKLAAGSKKGEVAFTKAKNARKVVVPATVKLADGKTYNVTSIAPKAFKNLKKLTQVTVGKNVKRIAKSAFFKTPKLKKIVVKSTLLKKASVKQALKGSKIKAKKIVVKVPKKAKKAAKKAFTKANLASPKRVVVK